MRVIEARDSDAVGALRKPWQDLEARCPTLIPYLTWEWCDAWWRQFGRGHRPCVLLFEDPTASPGPLVGIAPLFSHLLAGVPLRGLAWIGAGHSDYLGPLASPGNEKAVASAFLSYLRGDLRGWDVADLQELREDSPLGALRTPPWPDRPAGSHLLLPMQRCPYVALPPTWQELRKRVGPEIRRIPDRYENAIRKTFPDARFALAEAGDLPPSLAAFFRLHQTRWRTFRDPGVRAFHADVAARFAERGWLRLHIAEFQGGIHGALYCFSLGGRTFAYLGAYAPEFARYRIGLLLTGRALRRAIEDGCTEFDFQRGGEAYKYYWASGERENRRILLVRARPGLAGLGELPGRTWLLLHFVKKSLRPGGGLGARERGEARREGGPA